ncbi:MAG: hypothetical protein RR220_04135 [Bacteroidaceae bacterium]
MDKWGNLKEAKFFNPKDADDNIKSTDERVGSRRRSTVCIELSNKYLYRRAFSETKLLDVVDFDYKKNYSYHFITGGDVDSLSFLKTVLRQQNLDYLLFSTLCMAAEDVLQLDEWMKEGKIKKMDAYLGETFPSTYKIEYQMMQDMFDRHQCGRIAVFKNHSKIYAGYGEKFHFAIESSANINTNPRTENGCITIDEGLYQFYKDFFDGINSFE